MFHQKPITFNVKHEKLYMFKINKHVLCVYLLLEVINIILIYR